MENEKYRIHMSYVAIILAIITGVFFYGKHEGARNARLENENEFLKGRVKELETIVDTANVKIKQVRIERNQDNQKSAAEKIELRRSRDYYKRKIAELKLNLPTKSIEIDSGDTHGNFSICDTVFIQGVIEASSFKDSLLAVDDQLIFSLEQSEIRLTDSYEKEIALMQSKYDAQQQISDTWRKGYESSQKEIKKQRRGKRFWRSMATVFGIGAAGLLIGSQ